VNLNQLRIFHAVANTENYARAAQQLFLSQPYVYKQMRQLERELGCVLFHRVEKRAVLTEEGRVLFDYASRMLELEDEANWAMDALASGVKEQLLLGAGQLIANSLLPSVIVAFERRYPSVHVVLDTWLARSPLREDNLRLNLDLGFAPWKPPATYAMTEEIMRSEFVLCAGPSHHLTKQIEIHPGDLVAEPFIWVRYQLEMRRRVQMALAGLGIRPRSGMVLASPEVVKKVVAEGHGIAAIPRFAVREEVEAGRLRPLTLRGFHCDYPIYCIRHKARPLFPAAEAFLVLAREFFACWEGTESPLHSPSATS